MPDVEPDYSTPLEELSEHGRAQTAASVSLIRQGKWKFYTLTMPSALLAKTCFVSRRVERPEEGFQRELEQKRAQDIANYIDSGFGTIPGAIILSAQREAGLQYNSQKKTIRFRQNPRAFLVLDGQHRVYGFSLAKKKNLRVPVVIYNDLSLTDETRLFIDINTKQRPVPTALLLDIRRQAGIEKRAAAHMRDVFDHFNREPDSVLSGLLSAAKQVPGKISRPDFNKAYRAIRGTFGTDDPREIYMVLNAYFTACADQLKSENASDSLTDPVMFKALLMLFRHIAERVKFRYNGEYTAEHFNEALTPVFQQIPTRKLTHPPEKLKDLWNVFDKALIRDLSIDTKTSSAIAS